MKTDYWTLRDGATYAFATKEPVSLSNGVSYGNQFRGKWRRASQRFAIEIGGVTYTVPVELVTSIELPLIDHVRDAIRPAHAEWPEDVRLAHAGGSRFRARWGWLFG